MKVIHVLLASALALFTLPSNAQDPAGSAYDIDGKVVFAESTPANPYRHLGTVNCAVFSPDTPDELIEHMIKRAAKFAEEEGKEYDAIILRAGAGFCKADVIAYYADPKAKKKSKSKGDEQAIDPKKKESKANKREGMFLFIKNSPKAEHKLLGKVELPATFESSAIEDYIKEMIGVAKEKYPNSNGIVFIEGTKLSKANIIQIN